MLVGLAVAVQRAAQLHCALPRPHRTARAARRIGGPEDVAEVRDRRAGQDLPAADGESMAFDPQKPLWVEPRRPICNVK